MKKPLFTLYCLFLVLLFSTASFSQGVQPFGLGTPEDPYQVQTLDNLLWISTHNSSWDSYFIQTTDIDASEMSTWNGGAGFSPIGLVNYSNDFSGQYDGQGHTIDGLYINRPGSAKQGMFGIIIGGTVKNLGLTNVNITGSSNVGSLAGLLFEGSNIINCYSTGNIYGQFSNGGLIGATDQSFDQTTFIKYCCSFVDVVTTSSAGNQYGAGGLVGKCFVDTHISNCFARGSVSGNEDVGGLIGYCGYDVSILNCYSTGSVTGNINLGGLVGNNSSSSATNSFWDIETSGQSASALGTGKTPTEMKTQSIFTDAGWDFICETNNGSWDYWFLNKFINNGYPELKQHFQYPSINPLGTGTESDPYQIATYQDLLWMCIYSCKWDKYFIQTADIDASATSTLNSVEGFTPIGNSTTNFTGKYNGQQYAIDGLYINRPNVSFQGMFAYVSNSSIENLGLSNVNITGLNYTGGLAGWITDASNISNCFSSGSIVGAYSIGGLIGINNNSSVVSNCCTSGIVDGGDDTGGLVGRNYNSTVATSYSSCDVDGYWETGGLVGMNTETGIIENCYSTGNVSGNANNGGLLGRNEISSLVSNCYSTGNVSGNINNGGLVSDNISSSQVNNSFWDTQSSGQTSSSGGLGKTTEEMQDLLTFIISGWDFMDEYTNGIENIWGINTIDNSSYPFLAWQGYTHEIPVGYPQEGNGAVSAPFEIETLDNLQWLSSRPEVWNMHFIQTADIDASATTTWDGGQGFSPIGIDNNTPFTGSYNGQGQTIDGLYINRPVIGVYQGLFGYTMGGNLSDIGVINVNITGHHIIGAVVAHCHNNSSISDCYSTGSVNGETSVGGLVGECSNSTISISYSKASVIGSGYTGGLVEKCNYGNINNCYSTGSVSGSPSGGLIGYIWDSQVLNSFWDTQTSGQTNSAGGIGKTTAEMQDIMTYMTSGWDFIDESINGTEDNWGINPNENSGYPFLEWQDYTQPSLDFPEGEGTETSPYEIETPYHLSWLSNLQVTWDKYFIQTADIDVSATITWNGGEGFDPIGIYPISPFTGSYDGQGHVIDGLFINRPAEDHQGLFGYISKADISNVGIINLDMTGKWWSGGLVGGCDSSSICNSYTNGNIVGNANVGLLVGSCINNSTICNSYSSGSIEGENSVGGLVGYCYNSSINKSYNNGNIIANGTFGGGLIGRSFHSSIGNSFNNGTVDAESDVGGLVGKCYGDSVFNCYNSGLVIGIVDVGGFVGNDYLLNSQILNSFWDIESSGQLSSDGGTGKTTAEMQDIITYMGPGWDFIDESINGTEDNWGINDTDNGGYPFLTWQGYTSETLVGIPAGEGTEAMPYEIETLNNLKWVSRVQNYWDKFLIQTADIDASATTMWNGSEGFYPIGIYEDNPFTGNYDGQGYTIDGLYINRPNVSFQGMFAYVSNSSIKNLGLSNVNITGLNYTGGLAGWITDASNISNCFSSGSIVGAYSVGGLIGINNNSSVVSNCCTSGIVDGGDDTGGLVGRNYNSTVETSYSSCDVDGYWETGGLVGMNTTSGNILNCYSTGPVWGNANNGGLLGRNEINSVVSNCYSTGNVSGNTNIGGLVSDNISSSQVNNSFWDTQTSGQTASSGGDGKLTSEMKILDTFTDAGWDFIGEITNNGSDDCWNKDGFFNNNYPFLSYETAAWTGGVSSDWFDTNNWYTGAVPTSDEVVSIALSTTMPVINNGTAIYDCINIDKNSSLTIASQGSLTVSGVLNNVGLLLIQADASGMGSLIHNTDGVAANVECYFEKDQWHGVSSSISDGLSGTFDGTYLKYYSEADSVWSYIQSIVEPLIPGNGYFAWNYDKDKTITYSGTLNNGDASPILSFTAEATHQGKGWNLIGNPFPSYIDFDGLWTRNNIDGTIYLYNGSQYVTWNGSTGAHGSGEIAPGQAFWVHANADNPSISIPQNKRTHGSQAFYKNEPSNLLTLKVSGNGFEDMTYISIDDKATKDFDHQWDAYKLFGVEEAPQLYSIASSINLCVNALPKEGELSVPLGIKTGAQEIYTLEANTSVFTSYPDIYIEDLKTGEIIDLKKTGNYDFVSVPEDSPFRFILHFFKKEVHEEFGNYNVVNIYSYDEFIVLKSIDQVDATLQLLDLMGKKVFEKSISFIGHMQIKVEVPTGIYIAKWANKNQTITKRIFIQ